MHVLVKLAHVEYFPHFASPAAAPSENLRVSVEAVKVTWGGGGGERFACLLKFCCCNCSHLCFCVFNSIAGVY